MNSIIGMYLHDVRQTTLKLLLHLQLRRIRCQFTSKRRPSSNSAWSACEVPWSSSWWWRRSRELRLCSWWRWTEGTWVLTITVSSALINRSEFSETKKKERRNVSFLSLGNKRQHQWCWRQDFRHQKQENDEWEQDADAEGHLGWQLRKSSTLPHTYWKCLVMRWMRDWYLFSGLGRQVEDQNAKERNEHRWQNQVHGVEEGLAPNSYVKRDVRQGSLGFIVDIEISGNLKWFF